MEMGCFILSRMSFEPIYRNVHKEYVKRYEKLLNAVFNPMIIFPHCHSMFTEFKCIYE